MNWEIVDKPFKMSTEQRNEMIWGLMRASSNKDMTTVKQYMSIHGYNIDIGKQALGIALSMRHCDIAYQLLSFPGALEDYFDHPFKVDRGLRKAVQEYINRIDQ